MSACGGLKKRSIADGVTLLVEKHLGPEEVASFATAHKLRNKLSHAGVGEGLQVQVCNVQGVVKKLIASLVKDAIGNAKS